MADAPALFAPGESVATARLNLSLAAFADIDAMPWLAAALAPEFDMGDLAAHVAAGDAVAIARSGSRDPLGLAVARLGSPEAGAACMPLIAIAPPHRFRGLGGEAGLALERRILDRGAVGRVLAPVPEGRGLAVYFWLRLGYRPLIRSQAPWPLSGLADKAPRGIWMARDQRPAAALKQRRPNGS